MNDENYQRIFIEMYEPLCRYAMKFVIERDLAEDVVQDCFAYLWENWKRLNQIDNHQFYLYKTVKNRALNVLAKQYDKSKILNLEDYRDNQIDNNSLSAHDLLEIKDLELILESALQKLPERCRIIFVLKRFDDKTNKEVAELLNISVKTVENQMTIAIKKLNDYVVKNWGETALVLFSVFIKKSIST